MMIDGDAEGVQPLAGIRVLDLTRVLSGPYATMLLADMGAEVWKIEEPTHGDQTRSIAPTASGESHYFLSVNRSKQSIALDLKHPRGREIVTRLVREADIVIENFRPGVAERLGLDYATLAEMQPALVYCSISGFGQTGPFRERAAFDVAIQAMSGIMSMTGEPGGTPVRSGVPIADLVAGILGALGSIAALRQRDLTGQGQHVDVSMLDSMISLLSYLAGRYFMTGEEQGPVGSGHPSVVPYGAVHAADGLIVLAPLAESYWASLCDVIGAPSAVEDPRFSTNDARLAHRTEVDALLHERFQQHDVTYWLERLNDADIPHAPVLSIGEALSHPQVLARGLVESVAHPTLGEIRVLGPAIRFSGSRRSPLVAPPELGADTAAVLRQVLGIEEGELASLMVEGVVRTAPEVQEI